MARMIVRLALVFLLFSMPAAARAQQFGPAEFQIKADDGMLMSNHRVAPAQAAQLEKLPGIFTVGSPKGDVTLVQFYDLNCPFCREAATDVDTLLGGDRALRLVFVPYPTLSVQSVEAARIELAMRELAAKRFLEFRKQIYAGRGTIDGNRALAVTDAMGLDRNKVIEIANAPRTTETLKAHALLGTALKMVATPSYVVQGVAILGHPGLEPLQKAIKSVRTCKAVVC
jgi:protein-disulfide isomerase